MNLTFEEYQKRAAETAKYPTLIMPDNGYGSTHVGYVYPAFGLCGESGEVAEKVKKLIRDKEGVVSDEDRLAIKKEIGDCLWYIAALCKEFGLEMGDVAQTNLNKLAARKAAGTIGGSGDNR